MRKNADTRWPPRWRVPPGPAALAMRVLPAGSVVVSLCLVLVCALVLWQGRRDTARDAGQAAWNIASAVEQDIARNVEVYDLSLQGAIQALQLPGLDQLSPALRQRVLFDRSASARYLGFVNVLDATGTVIADSRFARPRPDSYAGRPYFQAQRADPRNVILVSRPFLTAPGQQASIAFTRRMTHPDGSFAGVVVGSMRLAYFRALFAHLALGPHGSIALLRSDGVVLMRLPFDANDIGRGLAAESPLAGFLRSGEPRVEATDPIDQVRRAFTFRRVGDLPLVIGVGLAAEDIYAAWWRKAGFILSFVTVLGLLNLALVLWLRQALRRRGASEAATSHFLATMSHELRTPLNGIIGAAELLRDEAPMDPRQARRLRTILAAGEHLRAVVNRVLDYGSIEAQGTLPVVRRVTLGRVIDECRAMIEPAAGRKGLTLTCQVAPSVPAEIASDPGQLRQVLLNLLGNAVKFTDRGCVALLVLATSERLRIEVADTGRGVPADRRARLFAPYQRLEEDRTAVEGTGLGLAIAARLVHGLGGTIGHRDNAGGGSVFWVELPIGTAATATSAIGRPAVERPGTATCETAASATETPRTEMPATTATSATWMAAMGDAAPHGGGAAARAHRLRLLVVDDLAMNREILGDLLRADGHLVDEAGDGAAAVDAIAANDFDIVLMDLCMPGLDGLEATRRVRGLPGRRAQVTILGLSANAAAEHLRACRQAGMNGHIAKPVSRAALRATLAQAAAQAAGPAQRAWLAAAAAAPCPGGRAAILNADTLAEARSCMGGADVDRHLRQLAQRLVALGTVLAQPNADWSLDALRDLTHDLASVGMLGFDALAVAAARLAPILLEARQSAEPVIAELARVARASLETLRPHLTPARETAGRE